MTGEGASNHLPIHLVLRDSEFGAGLRLGKGISIPPLATWGKLEVHRAVAPPGVPQNWVRGQWER
jgi:hypothetical protein